MARKRRSDSGGGGASWLETYGDMVTLLLTFFIMLYSMSTIDSQKYAAIVASFSKQLNPEVYYQQNSPSEDGEGTSESSNSGMENSENTEKLDDIEQLYTMLQEYVKENELGNQVEVSKSEEYVFIRFSDTVTFKGYSNVLEQQGKDILNILADGLKLVDEYVEEVIIAGHTAEVKNDRTDIDRTLSTDRANTVLKYLENKNVIDPAKYLSIGYGLHSPIADNSTSQGRARNRRVEIFISRKGHPVSYTKKIQETINKNNDNTNDDLEYKRNNYIN